MGKNILASSGREERQSEDVGELPPVEHIAKSLLGLRWKDALFGMFGNYTCYFDRSGTRDRHKYTVVAGWVSKVQKWLEFETLWRDVLDAYGVPYFHMKEFAHSVAGSPFQSWKAHESKRRSFLDALASAIDGTVLYGTAIAIPHAVFEEVDAEYELSEMFNNEFVFAAREAAVDVNEWAWGQGIQPDRFFSNVRYVFEWGEQGENTAKKVFAAGCFSEPMFEPSRDSPQKRRAGVIPLQAADFAAYEYFRLYETTLSEINWKWPYPNPRQSWVRLRKNVDALHNAFNKWMIVRRCDELGIRKRERPK